MPTALLIGRFEDDLIGESRLRACASALPDWQLEIPAAHIDLVRRLEDVPAGIVRAGSTARRAAAADAVVFVGGTVLSTARVRSSGRSIIPLTRAASLTAAALVARRPVAMIGIGAARLDTVVARGLAATAVHLSDLMVLRDEESAHALTTAGVAGPLRVGADPTWGLVQPGAGRSTRSSRVRVIPPEHVAGSSRPIVEALRGAIGALVDAGIDVEIQGFARAPQPRDHLLLEALSRRPTRDGARRADMLVAPTSLSEAIASFAGVGAVLTYSQPGLIAACAALVPAIAVGDDLEVRAVARRLNQRRLPAGATTAALAQACVSALDDPEPSIDPIASQVEKAHEQFRLLRVLLARGHSDEVDSIGTLPLSPTPAIVRSDPS